VCSPAPTSTTRPSSARTRAASRTRCARPCGRWLPRAGPRPVQASIAVQGCLPRSAGKDYRSAPENSEKSNLRHAIAIGHEQLSARTAGRPGRSEKWRRRRCPWENQPPKRRCHGWYVQTTLSNHAWNCLRSLLAPLLSCALASIRAMALPPPGVRTCAPFSAEARTHEGWVPTSREPL
jgi:hypothetical protein